MVVNIELICNIQKLEIMTMSLNDSPMMVYSCHRILLMHKNKLFLYSTILVNTEDIILNDKRTSRGHILYYSSILHFVSDETVEMESRSMVVKD